MIDDVFIMFSLLTLTGADTSRLGVTVSGVSAICCCRGDVSSVCFNELISSRLSDDSRVSSFVAVLAEIGSFRVSG